MTGDTLLEQVDTQAQEPYFHPTGLGPECSTARSAHLRERRAAMAHEKRCEPEGYTRLAEEAKQVYLKYEAVDPALARAVGQALARNPFAVIVPCHRAIRTDGHLGGYQGGLDMKRSLLEAEGVSFNVTGRVIATRLHYAGTGL